MGDRAATAMASDAEVYMSSVDMMKAVSFQVLMKFRSVKIDCLR